MAWFCGPYKSKSVKINFKCQECESVFNGRENLQLHYISAHPNDPPFREDEIRTIGIRRLSESNSIALIPINPKISIHLNRHICVEYVSCQYLDVALNEVWMSCSLNIQTLIMNSLESSTEIADAKSFEEFKVISPQLRDLKLFHADLQDMIHMIGYCRSVESLSILNGAADIPVKKLEWMNTKFRVLRTFIFFDNTQLDIDFESLLSKNPQLKNVYTNNPAAIKCLISTKTAIRFVVARIESEDKFWDMVKKFMDCKLIQSMDLCFKYRVTETALRLVTILDYVEGIHFAINESILWSLHTMLQLPKIKRLCVKGAIDEEIAFKLAKLFPNIIELHIRLFGCELEVESIEPFIKQNNKIRDIYCNKDIDGIDAATAYILHEKRMKLPNPSKVMIHLSRGLTGFSVPEHRLVQIDPNPSDCCLFCHAFYLPNQFLDVNKYLRNVNLDYDRW